MSIWFIQFFTHIKIGKFVDLSVPFRCKCVCRRLCCLCRRCCIFYSFNLFRNKKIMNQFSFSLYRKLKHFTTFFNRKRINFDWLSEREEENDREWNIRYQNSRQRKQEWISYTPFAIYDDWWPEKLTTMITMEKENICIQKEAHIHSK